MTIDACSLTVLCENSAAPARDVLGEHGWAVLLESSACNLLFDTGNRTIIANSRALGKDLRQLDYIVLSHGHYDHANGLAEVLRDTGPINVMAHPGIFHDRYSCRGETCTEIGIPHKRSHLEGLGARFHPVTTFTQITTDVYVSGEIPRVTPFEHPDPHLRIYGDEGCLVPDPVADDQALVLDTVSGLVVILGCAHSGIINTLTHITGNLPGRPLHLVLGGTHLGFVEPSQFTATCQQLASFAIEHLGTAHCTGLTNGARLQERFGESVFHASAGTCLRVPFFLI
ncbi:MAG: MBL fold metallo-hydrolase [Desulfobulbus propionicus]|nr:MAG: MBL fold metallo-hydrolase [Desulfobulbus propionicus]